MTNELDTLRPEVREALVTVFAMLPYGKVQDKWRVIRAELLRLANENARLNKIESLATEQRLQMEDVELYLMDVSQPDDEDAPWCDRMKSAIELLVQDCNYAVGQKNKAEAELAALKARIAGAPVVACPKTLVHAGNTMQTEFLEYTHERMPGGCNSWAGKRVRLLVE